MELKEECKHDINIAEEHWMSDNSCLVYCICDKCGAKFTGIVIKN
jgi:hypothetical protein